MAKRSIVSSSTSHQSRSTNCVENGLALRSRSVTDPNKQSGSSPGKPDFLIENHGSIFLLSPQTDAGRAWIDENITREGFQPYWPTVVIEHRYVQELVEGIRNDGLVVAS